MRSLTFLFTLAFCICTLSLSAQTAKSCQVAKAQVTACKATAQQVADVKTVTKASLASNPICSKDDPRCQPCPPGCCCLNETATAVAAKAANFLASPLSQVQQLSASPNCRPVNCDSSKRKEAATTPKDKAKATASL